MLSQYALRFDALASVARWRIRMHSGPNSDNLGALFGKIQFNARAEGFFFKEKKNETLSKINFNVA